MATNPSEPSNEVSPRGPSLDTLITEAQVESQKAMKRIQEESAQSGPKADEVLSRLLSDEEFLSKCKSVLGEQRVESTLGNYEKLKEKEVEKCVRDVVDKYEAPHLYPDLAWSEGGPRCWSLYNLLNYAAHSAV